MECAKCGENTVDVPCKHCGEDPLLDGRYRLLQPCGRGASGTLWKAREESTGDVVAIKEMLLSRSDAEKTRQLWDREVRILRELSHVRIPAFVDSFVVGRGRSRSLCLVQEFIEGESLDQEMLSRRYSEAEVLDIARELLPVLEYLHGLSPPVVHRDLKPSNVMRRPDGSLVLIDFGSVRDALKDTQLGGSTVAGTFGYMAPEQFRGDASPATDYYGLGGLLVSLLTRKPPHTLLGPTGDLQWRSACRVEPATEYLIDQLLSRDPLQRPRGLHAFEDLLSVGYAQPVAPDLASLFEPQLAPELPGPVADNPLEYRNPEPRRRVLTPWIMLGAMALAGMALAFSVSVLALSAVTYVDEAPEPVMVVPDQPITPQLDTGLAKAVAPVATVQGTDPAFYIWNSSTDDLLVQVRQGSETVPDRSLMRLPLDEGVTSARVLATSHPIEDDTLLACSARGCEPMLWTPFEGDAFDALPPAWPVGTPSDVTTACLVDLRLAPNGTVAGAGATGCPAAFARSAEVALLRWRYEPSGIPSMKRVRVQFVQTEVRRPVLITQGASNALLEIDGAPMGRIPWKGELSPGAHVVTLEGVPPIAVVVDEGTSTQLIRF